MTLIAHYRPVPREHHRSYGPPTEPQKDETQTTSGRWYSRIPMRTVPLECLHPLDGKEMQPRVWMMTRIARKTRTIPGRYPRRRQQTLRPSRRTHTRPQLWGPHNRWRRAVRARPAAGPQLVTQRQRRMRASTQALTGRRHCRRTPMVRGEQWQSKERRHEVQRRRKSQIPETDFDKANEENDHGREAKRSHEYLDEWDHWEPTCEWSGYKRAKPERAEDAA